MTGPHKNRSKHKSHLKIERAEPVAFKLKVGDVVQLLRPYKAHDSRRHRVLPAFLQGRVAAVKAKFATLADQLTGEVFARSVPLTHLEPAPLPKPIDNDIDRLTVDELRSELYKVRYWLRRHRDAKPESRSGEEPFMYRECLPEFPYGTSAQAKETTDVESTRSAAEPGGGAGVTAPVLSEFLRRGLAAQTAADAVTPPFGVGYGDDARFHGG